MTYIQQSFRDRGLRCDVLQLFRLSLVALVKRQMLEGVQAVVKIFRRSQNTGKIPLQVFDRSSGLNNVRFDGNIGTILLVSWPQYLHLPEYEDLDASVAAEIVVRAKSTHLAPAPVSAQYPVGAAYGAPHYAQGSQALQQQQQPQEGGAPANITNLITSLDGPSLQKLLGAMAQSPQTSPNAQRAQPSQQPVQSQNLASLLSSVARQQVLPQQGYPYNTASQQQQYAGPVTNPSFADNPALSSLLSNANGRNVPQALPTQQHQQQPGQQQSVQDIMAQLARYKQ